MKHIPFSELQFTFITLDTHKGNIEGLFSERRLDIATIPDGLIPYDVRSDDDDDSMPATVEICVTVNYFGMIVVNEPLDFGGSDHIEILDWNFDDGPNGCPEWAREYL